MNFENMGGLGAVHVAAVYAGAGVQVQVPAQPGSAVIRQTYAHVITYGYVAIRK
jgi:hypothetical protein